MPNFDEQRLIEAIENVRRDNHHPWRYILFTFYNGIAWGLGMTIGMTIVLGIVFYVLGIILSHMINFPVIGFYASELIKLLETYVKAGPKIR